MVSIVVSVYNKEDKIVKCVDSLLAQTYKDLDIVLVDDGSSDQSPKVCDSLALKDARIRVFHQQNSGVSVARNTGINHAAGEYILFVDSDDYIAPDMVEKLLCKVEEHSNCCPVCGYRKVIGEQVRIVDVNESQSLPVTEIYSACPSLFSEFILNSPCNKLYKKDAIKVLFEKGLSMGEDLLFNLAYLDEVDCVTFVEGAPYYYVEEPGSLTKQYREDSIEIAERLYTECKKFTLKYGLGEQALADVGRIFMRSMIYGCDDINADSRIACSERRTRIKRWVENKSVQQAVRECVLDNSQLRLAAWFIRKRATNAFVLFLNVKLILNKVMKKR